MIETRETNHEQESAGSSAPWHAVYTRHQHERVVARNLESKGFETFLPLYPEIRRWKDRRKQLHVPLFPSYVFVHDSMERRLDVLSTPGVHSLVGNAGRAAVIPPSEIRAIRRLVEAKAHIEPHPYLHAGDRISVQSGPLQGLEGIFVRKKSGTGRLVVSVELLQRSVAVEIEDYMLEAVSPRAVFRGDHQNGTPPAYEFGSGFYRSTAERNLAPLGNLNLR